MNHSIKLIAVDLDGTLLNDHHQLQPKTEDALKKAIDRGIYVVLATGKTRYSSGPLIKRLNLTTPGVFSQGLIIADPDGTIRHQIDLPDPLAAEVARTGWECGISFVAYRDIEIHCIANDPMTDIMVDYDEPYPEPAGSLDALLGKRPFQKFIFVAEPERLLAFHPQLTGQFAGRLSIVFSQKNMLEFVPLGTSKGAGLEQVMRHLAVEPAEVIAFGDGDNDVEMLSLAGIGVAMGNAMPQPRAVADYVTGTNNEDGIAQALDRFLFG